MTAEDFLCLAGLADDGIEGAMIGLRPLRQSDGFGESVETALEVAAFKLEEARLWLRSAIEKHAKGELV